ncbi:MAG TPA: hypothetical protein PKH24_00640 [Sedimentisphaerales bacterium]|jgi:hypothetical protein|nr:hypothetical protein [Sedimentisphaerales bacterium]HNU27600.1 hypothetical protein [Sedimentisphaerales bacterium]
MRKKSDSMMKAVFVVALTALLCLGMSCKKQPDPAPTQPPAQDTQAKPAEVKPAEVKPAETPAQPTVTEAPKPAETAPAPAPAPAQAAAPAGYAPLALELPKPMFVGTPQDMKVDNLEKPLGRARPPFLAPAGAVLLSRGKPVSASDEEPIIGEIEMITDGDKEAADGSYVELGPLMQYVTIDLEKQCELYAIVVWHYHKQPRVYHDVVVQLSNDKDFITDVKTVFNNDTDNSSGQGIGKDMHYVETNEGKLIDLVSQGSPKARYIRLYSNTNTSNDLNHYIEVEAFGKPVE